MKKIKVSNLQKMEQLYSLYETKMYSIAYGILKNVEQAEDVVQDSFIKISDYLDKIKSAEDDKTKYLILKIVKTTAINVYRKNKKENSLFNYNNDIEIEDPQNIIEAKIVNMYNHQILDSIIMNMPEIYKEIIKLRYYYELSNAEISNITGIDSSTIRKRNERAKKYIVKRLGGSEDEKRSEALHAELREKNI